MLEFYVEQCPRCGLNHGLLRFKELTRPATAPGLAAYTHWAMCPGLNEPVFLARAVAGARAVPPLPEVAA